MAGFWGIVQFSFRQGIILPAARHGFPPPRRDLVQKAPQLLYGNSHAHLTVEPDCRGWIDLLGKPDRRSAVYCQAEQYGGFAQRDRNLPLPRIGTVPASHRDQGQVLPYDFAQGKTPFLLRAFIQNPRNRLDGQLAKLYSGAIVHFHRRCDQLDRAHAIDHHVGGNGNQQRLAAADGIYVGNQLVFAFAQPSQVQDFLFYPDRVALKSLFHAEAPLLVTIFQGGLGRRLLRQPHYLPKIHRAQETFPKRRISFHKVRRWRSSRASPGLRGDRRRTWP